MNLLDVELRDIFLKFPELSGKDSQVILDFILGIYKKCYGSNPEYDGEFDMEMVILGLKMDEPYGGHNHNIWNNGMFEDDGFGFGNEPVTMYGDYIENQEENLNVYDF